MCVSDLVLVEMVSDKYARGLRGWYERRCVECVWGAAAQTRGWAEAVAPQRELQAEVTRYVCL